MAAKIFVLLALLALSASAPTAVFIPQCSSRLSAAAMATVPQYSPLTAVGSAHSFVQSYRQQQAFTTAISPLPVVLQQQLAFQHQIQAITTLQQQQQVLSHLFNQLAIVNPAAYWRQQQLLPFNQLAVANPAQQLLPFNQLAALNPAVFLQQPIIGGACC